MHIINLRSDTINRCFKLTSDNSERLTCINESSFSWCYLGQEFLYQVMIFIMLCLTGKWKRWWQFLKKGKLVADHRDDWLSNFLFFNAKPRHLESIKENVNVHNGRKKSEVFTLNLRGLLSVKSFFKQAGIFNVELNEKQGLFNAIDLPYLTLAKIIMMYCKLKDIHWNLWF